MYSARAQGLDITVGVDDNRRVRWVSTSDPNFVSPEGLRVGDPIAQAIAVAGAPLFGEPGWAWHVQLPSGWHARVNPIVETPDGLKFSFPQHDHPDPPSDAVIGDFFMRN